MVATITTGNENVEGAHAKFYVFAKDTSGSEVFLNLGTGVRRMGTVGTEDAVRGGRVDANGQWQTVNYDIVEGTLLKLYANVRARWNAQPVEHSMWLQAGEDFDFIEITVALSQHHRCARQNVTMQGKFRVLTLAQAIALGARTVSGNWALSFKPFDHRESLMSMRVLQRGVRRGARATSTEPIPASTIRENPRNRRARDVRAEISAAVMRNATERMEQAMLGATARAVPVEPTEPLPPEPPPQEPPVPPSQGGLQRRRRMFS